MPKGSKKRPREAAAPLAAAASIAPPHGSATQVLFSFKAALHVKESRPCRLTGELCVWMFPASSSGCRRTLVSGSTITGRILSSADPNHLGQAVAGRITGQRVWGAPAPRTSWRDSRLMEVDLCGHSVSVDTTALHTWEQDEGGKLILANAEPLFCADEIAVLFTTLSARLPGAGEAVEAVTPSATAAPAVAAKAEASSSRKSRRSARLATGGPAVATPAVDETPWSDLAARFLARNFRPLTATEKERLRSQGVPSDKVDAVTHLHMKSGQCHEGARFAAAAVEAYRAFLRLKAQHDDAVCQIWLDEVWHTHLQDVGSYRRDCAALLGAGTLIEHTPLPPSESRRRYRATYTRHRDAGTAGTTATGEFDEFFWPEPRPVSDDDPDEEDDFSIDQELEEEDVVCG
jgi:hypothetical protein